MDKRRNIGSEAAGAATSDALEALMEEENAVGGPYYSSGGSEPESIHDSEASSRDDAVDNIDEWAIIEAHFDEKGLVRQQLDSFDEFVSNTILEVVQETPPIVIRPKPTYEPGQTVQKVSWCLKTFSIKLIDERTIGQYGAIRAIFTRYRLCSCRFLSCFLLNDMNSSYCMLSNAGHA